MLAASPPLVGSKEPGNFTAGQSKKDIAIRSIRVVKDVFLRVHMCSLDVFTRLSRELARNPDHQWR